MAYKDFMNKVRRADNLAARWLMRHFYFTFFQVVLLIIFIFWFRNLLSVIDASFDQENQSATEHLLVIQSINSAIVAVLLILNSFWMLYVFNGIQRMTNLLKDISFHINRLRINTGRRPS